MEPPSLTVTVKDKGKCLLTAKVEDHATISKVRPTFTPFEDEILRYSRKSVILNLDIVSMVVAILHIHNGKCCLEEGLSSTSFLIQQLK